jgi:sugar phosphate isomerase/epimerase
MRLALSSSSFRRPLAAGALTQLEWVERCANALDVDGVLVAAADFPRGDADYVAQVRKVAVDLGIVPFGLEASGLLDPPTPPEARERVLALAARFGAAVVRTTLPPPGEVPAATFAATVLAAKAASKAAKAVNVTIVVPPQFGTLGDDLAAVKHLLKDVDSAWLRACPPALLAAGEPGGRRLLPAVTATSLDDPAAVAAAAGGTWVVLELAPDDAPWDAARAAIDRLRDAAAAHRLAARA